ncbi:MAG: hypothetical protein HYW07_02610 [Candidatus Latescibacteria bacterium]|nr:hypothetical protein [Candidatus Latescibacterota bacterium]
MFPDEEISLLAYVEFYLPPERREELRQCAQCEVRFLPYDWQLNDQRGPSR